MDQAADTGCFEQIFKQVIPKTPAYMGEKNFNLCRIS